MTGIDGGAMREWRRGRGWDVPALARELRRAAGNDTLPVHDALVRMIRRWEREGLRTERYELLYRSLGLGETAADDPAEESVSISDVMAWISGTDTADGAIGEMSRAAAYLAEVHAAIPARKVLREVLGVHQGVNTLLRDGHPRIRQARELVRIDSDLMAHASLLYGDLGIYPLARRYGNAALAYAQEAEADEGLAWAVMAKTARWETRYTEAAGLAARGSEATSRPHVQSELAYREANVIAMFGDIPRAQAVLRRADAAGDPPADEPPTVWSFPAPRRAVFALAARVHTGDAEGALAAAADADAYWAAGTPQVTATWAQVRAGAAIARLLQDDLDGAVAELSPVLRLPAEQRIDTVTGYVTEAAAILAGPRFAGSGTQAALREQIAEFTDGAEDSR